MGQDQGAASVLAAQGGAPGVPVRGDVRDERQLFYLGSEFTGRPFGARAVHVAVAGRDEQGEVGVAGAEVVAQPVTRVHGLGAGGAPVREVEVVLGARAVRAQAEEDENRADQHGAAVPHGESAEPSEHEGAFLRRLVCSHTVGRVAGRPAGRSAGRSAGRRGAR